MKSVKLTWWAVVCLPMGGGLACSEDHNSNTGTDTGSADADTDGDTDGDTDADTDGDTAGDADGDGIPDSEDAAPDNPCIPDNTIAACDAVKGDVDAYFNALPDWETFAYAEKDKLPEEQEGVEEVVDGSETVAEVLDGDNLTKVCTTERVSFYDTPSEYVMFATPGILYPGALIQGKSLRDGATAGDLLPLNVAQRGKVRVSIPACAFEENFEEVMPSQAEVSSAVGAIIKRAEEEGVDCIEARGNLEVETFSSENERALKAGISGRYFGFSGEASGEFSKSVTETTVAAIFKESLFTARIQAPQSPSGWFSDEFTPELLMEQVDLGRIGPDNIPAYVAEVTYGRLMMFTMTSEASATAMKTHINFKYENPVSEVEADLTAEQKQQISRAKYTAAYLGEGSGYAWLATLDWSAYFAEDKKVTASDAVPVSFSVKSTRDDVPAMIQEITEYNRTTCVDKLAGAGTFEFGDKQSVDTGFGAGVQTGKKIVVADINGDYNADVAWAATDPDHLGEIVVGLSNGDGTFSRIKADDPNVGDDRTGDLTVLAGDVDADGRDDLVLNLTGADNFVYVIFLQPVEGKDDAFVYSAEQQISGSGWQTYTAKMINMDGERGMDLVWNNAVHGHATENKTHISVAVDTAVDGFDLETDALFAPQASQLHQATNWTAYDYWHVGDFNGDGLDDFVWQDMDAGGNRFYLATSTGTGLDFGSGTQNYHDWGGNWGAYVAFAGNIHDDNTRRADLIMPRVNGIEWDADPNQTFAYYVAEGSSARPYIDTDLVWSDYVSDVEPDSEIKNLFPGETPESDPAIPGMYIADVDGNGRDDLIITQTHGARNDIGVGVAAGDAAPYLTFSRKIQSHPDQSQGEWDRFSVFFGNVDGDDGNNRDDILWISDGEPSVIYTGRARPAE